MAQNLSYFIKDFSMNEYEKLGRIIVERHNTPHTKNYKRWSELFEKEIALMQKLAKEEKEQVNEQS